jgi:hypothetical protein
MIEWLILLMNDRQPNATAHLTLYTPIAIRHRPLVGLFQQDN